MKYRNRPVEIEAVRWTGKNHREMFDFLTNYEKKDAYMDTYGENFFIDHGKLDGGLVLRTSTGDTPVVIGNYVMKSILGTFGPVNADLFEAAYALVE